MVCAVCPTPRSGQNSQWEPTCCLCWAPPPPWPPSLPASRSSVCRRRNSRRKVHSPGTFTMELRRQRDATRLKSSSGHGGAACVRVCHPVYLGSPSSSATSSSSSSLPLYSYSGPSEWPKQEKKKAAVVTRCSEQLVQSGGCNDLQLG